MTLVDTSVWIEHLRIGNEELRRLLQENEVLMHPFIAGELACGSLTRREEILQLLQALPQAHVAGHGEVLALVDKKRLWGRGAGWVDMHLLAAALLSRARLWTLDRPLSRLARVLQVLR